MIAPWLNRKQRLRGSGTAHGRSDERQRSLNRPRDGTTSALRPVSQLTIRVASPAVSGAARRDSTCMVTTSTHGRETQSTMGFSRVVPPRCGGVAELSVAAIAPTVRGTISSDSACVAAAARDPDEGMPTVDADWDIGA